MKTKPNKSQLIRDLLKQHPAKSPAEVAVLMKSEHGLKISGQYVSTIKTNDKKKRRAKRQPIVIDGHNRVAAVRSSWSSDNGMSALPALLNFLRASGGIENAKAALATIEEIGKAI